jgi:hypothetical protein
MHLLVLGSNANDRPKTLTSSPTLTVRVSGVLDRFNFKQLCFPHHPSSSSVGACTCRGPLTVPAVAGEELEDHQRSGWLTLQMVVVPCLSVSGPSVKAEAGGTTVRTEVVATTPLATTHPLVLVHH